MIWRRRGGEKEKEDVFDVVVVVVVVVVVAFSYAERQKREGCCHAGDGGIPIVAGTRGDA